MRSAIALVSSLALGAQVTTASCATPLYTRPVNIPGYGKVQGKAALNDSVAAHVSNWADISFFGGIPFGADTSGANRWAAPKPAAAWNGTLNATAFGDICPSGSTSAYASSEDCLSLNVWTPASAGNATAAKLPVAIWSYGAGTSPPQTTYNGAGVAAKGIVFVSYNYRAGAFGFLSTAELTEEVGRNASGNWGVMDQYAAVRWVHENIAAFGGDPDHISVIGQSFGAAAVYHIINSNMTADLGIVNGISESGVRSPNDPNVQHYECGYLNSTAGEALGEQVLAALNVTTIAEARALSADDINTGTSSFSFSLKPVLDYYTIPSEYITTLSDGAANKVPYITGNNADEDGASSSLNTTVADYLAWLNQTYADFADDFLALYPADNDTQAATSETAIVRDQFRVSSWQYMAGFSASAPAADTYTYYWDYSPPAGSGGGTALGGGGGAAATGATHASEIVYALGNLWAQAGVEYAAADYAVSAALSAYWANFIKTGDPNEGGGSGLNGSLPAAWGANSAAARETFLVGEVYGNVAIADDAAKIALLEKFFAASVPA